MSTIKSITDQLKKLISQSNKTTGKNDSDATLAIESLIAGYGNGETGGSPSIPSVGSNGFLKIVLNTPVIQKIYGEHLVFSLSKSNANINDVIS